MLVDEAPLRGAAIAAAMASTTCAALAEVQQASDSAFTAALVLT